MTVTYDDIVGLESWTTRTFDNGCVHKSYITSNVPNGCICTLTAYPIILYPTKVLSSIFPVVMYSRFMSLFFVNVPPNCVRYWHTQLPCTQGSKLYVPNGCAPKINIIAGIPSGCVHKIHITTNVPSGCVHGQ